MENRFNMKKFNFFKPALKGFLGISLLFFFNNNVEAQLCEWRLTNSTFNATDPDGGGPAIGSVTFTAQVHTVSAGSTIPLVTAISTGYMYQSAYAMVPTGVNCPLANSPSNITLSAAFLAGGYSYLDVNQCGVVDITAGGRAFNRRAVGTLFATGAGVTITDAWMDMFTVTLWALNPAPPQGGYAALNSGSSSPQAPPNEFDTYSISDQGANEYGVTSLTFDNPLALPTGAAPVLFSQFTATCSPNGTLINWKTAQESNSNYFEVERSVNGTSWTSIGRTAAAGNSSNTRAYAQLDLEAGNAMYRIKQVDKDGQFIYTGIERANCQVKNITSVIYPVPAQTELNVVIKSDRAIRTQLLVFDATGRAVRRENVNIVAGSNNFKISLAGLSSGEYMLKSPDAELDLRKQFTIIR